MERGNGQGTTITEQAQPEAVIQPDAAAQAVQGPGRELLDQALEEKKSMQNRLANLGRSVMNFAKDTLETVQEKTKNAPPYFKSPKAISAGALLFAGGVAARQIRKYRNQAESQTFFQKAKSRPIALVPTDRLPSRLTRKS